MNAVSVEKADYNLMVLEILKEYSDPEHRLTQQDIVRIAKEKYNTEIDRRSVKRNVEQLAAFYDIDMSHGYCLAHREFDNAELRMLIDSVLFSRTITQEQARTLIEKLKSLGNRYFRANVSNVSSLPDFQRSDNRQILTSIDTISDAIDQNRKISYNYVLYGTDLKQHAQKTARTVSPYRMAANNGRFYLICFDERHGSISYLRVDRMMNVRILAQARVPLETIPGMEHGLDLPKQMAEHFYMFSGPSVPVRLRADLSMMSNLVDWFGRDITVLARNEKSVEVRVTCNENSIFYWALQYGQSVEVLSPKDLRERLRNALKEMYEKYSR